MSQSTSSATKSLVATAMKRRLEDFSATAAPMIDLTEDDEVDTLHCNIQTPKRTRLSENATVFNVSRSDPRVNITDDVKLISPKSPLEERQPQLGCTLPSKQRYNHVEKSALVTPRSPIEFLESPVEHEDGSTPSQRTISTLQLSTPETTPQKKSDLEKLPELANRYLAKTATSDGIEYTNPQKFCLKPAYYREWKAKHYLSLAEHMRFQFDPIPFSLATGIPLVEVAHMVSGLVFNPLYYASEAKRRGEEAMQEIMEFHDKYGTPKRPWSTKKIVGELHGVATGSVEVIVEGGLKHHLDLSDLTGADVKYLKETLTKQDKRMLLDGAVAFGGEENVKSG